VGFKIRRCLRSFRKKWDTFDWRGDHERVLMLYADLKAAGATVLHGQLVSRIMFGDEYDDTLTIREWDNADSEKTWKRETVETKGLFLCSECKGCNIETMHKDRYYDIAIKLLETHPVITLLDTDEMLIYKDGIYRPYGQKIIAVELQKMLKDKFNSNLFREVIKHIQSMTYCNRSDFDNYPYEINLKNGIYDVENQVFMPHDPSHLSVIQLPFDYDPMAVCPTVNKFFTEVLYEKDILAMEEFFGFCLYRDYFLKKFFILQGDGDNGKSVMLGLLEKFLGVDNCSDISMQALSDDKFAISSLYGKMSNIGDDVPSSGLKNTGTIKQLTGRSVLHAQRKFEPIFKYQNYAKLIFSANNVPTAWDDSDAFYGRVRIIILPNKFTDNKDVWLGEKLSAELPGLFNCALAALYRLLANLKFTNDSTISHSKESFLRKSNSVYCFVTDRLEIDGMSDIPKQELLYEYQKYCLENKMIVATDKRFFTTLPKLISVMTVCTSDGKCRTWCFRGIRFRKPIDNCKIVIAADGYEECDYS
jgi:putative DNA primase/helicase